MTQATTISPFGGTATLQERLHSSEIIRRYKNKCGMDISFALDDIEFAELYQCEKTGYKFWLPSKIAGGEDFYAALSAVWPDYYRSERWEYSHARQFIQPGDSCLEVGCGRGFFLGSIERICKSSVGLEFNNNAIKEKVCKSRILNQDISDYQSDSGRHDNIFFFQVLEHIPEPLEFIKSCLVHLKPTGKLVISVPNDEWIIHKNMQDAFNLPPHHVGGYNPLVFQKIAELLHLEVVTVKTQPANFPAIEVTEPTARQIPWKVFRRLADIVGDQVLRYCGEPGHTMLVVLTAKV